MPPHESSIQIKPFQLEFKSVLAENTSIVPQNVPAVANPFGFDTVWVVVRQPCQHPLGIELFWIPESRVMDQNALKKRTFYEGNLMLRRNPKKTNSTSFPGV